LAEKCSVDAQTKKMLVKSVDCSTLPERQLTYMGEKCAFVSQANEKVLSEKLDCQSLSVDERALMGSKCSF